MPLLSRNQVEAAVREENTEESCQLQPSSQGVQAHSGWLGAGRGKGDLGLMGEGAFTEPERANQIDRLYCSALSGALSHSIFVQFPPHSDLLCYFS